MQSAATLSVQVGEAPAQDGTTEASTSLFAHERVLTETGACETRSLYLNSIVLSHAVVGHAMVTQFSGDGLLPFRCVHWSRERGILSFQTDRRLPAGTSLAFDIGFVNSGRTQTAQRVTIRVGDGNEEVIGAKGG